MASYKNDPSECAYDDDNFMEDFDFEIDMEKGKYKVWVEKHPDRVYDIFGAYLSYFSDQTEKDIRYFVEKGVDLNKKLVSCSSSGDAAHTPLCFACEYRNIPLIRLLLQAGVSPNTPVVYNRDLSWYPVLCALQGHSASHVHPSEAGKVVDIIFLLLEFGLNSKCQIPRDFYDEFLKYESDQITNFVSKSFA